MNDTIKSVGTALIAWAGALTSWLEQAESIVSIVAGLAAIAASFVSIYYATRKK